MNGRRRRGAPGGVVTKPSQTSPRKDRPVSMLAPDAQITEPSPLAYDSPPADILARAADYIQANGLWQGGDFWRDSHSRRWTSGEPCCTVGTVGVVLARTRHAGVACDIIPATLGDPYGDEPPHPAVAALMAYLHVNLPELFRWSDDSPAEHVAAVMRACAAELRAQAA